MDRTMVECYFGNDDELSQNWMVSPMNFGQNLQVNESICPYKMSINVKYLKEWSIKVFSEIIADAQNFPDDWGRLGQILKQYDGIDFTALLKMDSLVAYEFAVDFAYEILLDVERRHSLPLLVNPVYQLHTSDGIELSEQRLIIQGKAIITNQKIIPQ
jgi:hypothetical protein